MNRLIIALFVALIVGGITSSSFAEEKPVRAAVTFGAWKTDTPLDRFSTPNPAPALNQNLHQLIPNMVTIKQGGSVDFIFAGTHIVSIYDDGTKPEEIDVTVLEPGITMGGGVINDTVDRLYRGWNVFLIPGTAPRERVESVTFSEPGTYLVICAIKNHFVDDKMFGYVRVLPGK